jgi:ribosomal-protein-alanine N-acetyltransferase
MSAAPQRIVPKTMPFDLRPMNRDDIVQVEEVEREAFPKLFPPTTFRRELAKCNVSYLVAQDTVPCVAMDDVSRGGLFRNLLAGTKNVSLNAETCGRIAGFIGIWYMAGEAHVISLGVRTIDRSQGIGELLLIGALERAMSHAASVMTLEVRASNCVAINLYRKYGFEERGVRKAYYANNREDALIMTTKPILHPEYRDFFVALEREYTARWGATQRDLG